MRVALGQFGPVNDAGANVATMSALAQRATASGAELVVFPEYATWFSADMASRAAAGAEPLDGPVVETLRRIAREHRIALVFGMLEREGSVAEAPPFNTLVVVDDDGAIVTTYRKVHLYDAFGAGESRYLTAGDRSQRGVFELGGLTFGLQTCYDLRFPEVTRRRIDSGADVIVTPAQWVPGAMKELHWRTLNAARAVENVVYALAVGQSAPAGIGRSLAIDPSGATIAEADAADELVIVDLDMARLTEARRVNPSRELRRYRVTP